MQYYFFTCTSIIRKDSIETTVKNSIKEKERFLGGWGGREGKATYESLVCIFSLLQTSFWKSIFLALAFLPVRGVKKGFLICSNLLIIAASLELIRNFIEMLYLLGNTNERSQSTEVSFAKD